MARRQHSPSQNLPKRFCAESFVFEKEEDEAFLRCSRCKLTFYNSRAAQRSHWPVHKVTCSAPDTIFVATLSLAACIEQLQASLINVHTCNGNTVLLLRRVRALIESGEGREPGLTVEPFEGITAHAMAGHQAGIYYSLLWAVPGMADYLLNEPLSSEGVAVVGDPKTMCRCDVRKAAHDMSYLLFNLLVRTAVCPAHPGDDSVFFGHGALRLDTLPHALVSAAVQRALDLWLDEGVRDGCGYGVAAGPSLCLTFLKYGHLLDVSFEPLSMLCSVVKGKLQKDEDALRFNQAVQGELAPRLQAEAPEADEFIIMRARLLVRLVMGGMDNEDPNPDCFAAICQPALKVWSAACLGTYCDEWKPMGYFFEMLVLKYRTRALVKVQSVRRGGLFGVVEPQGVIDLIVDFVADVKVSKDQMMNDFKQFAGLVVEHGNDEHAPSVVYQRCVEENKIRRKFADQNRTEDQISEEEAKLKVYPICMHAQDPRYNSDL